MKINVRKTDNCIVIKVHVGSEMNFYITRNEVEQFINGDIRSTVDGGNIIVVHHEYISFVENMYGGGDVVGGDAIFTRIKLDTKRFFTVMLDLFDRDVLPEDDYMKFRSGSFWFKRKHNVVLGYAQILMHPQFRAHATLKNALYEVPREQLRELKKLISRIIDQGKVIVPDLGSSFYFYPEDRNGYNGGIIYHSGSERYSIHT